MTTYTHTELIARIDAAHAMCVDLVAKLSEIDRLKGKIRRAAELITQGMSEMALLAIASEVPDLYAKEANHDDTR